MWLEKASQWHEVYCHVLEVVSSNPGRVELGVCSISVPSRTWTKHIFFPPQAPHTSSSLPCTYARIMQTCHAMDRTQDCTSISQYLFYWGYPIICNLAQWMHDHCLTLGVSLIVQLTRHELPRCWACPELIHMVSYLWQNRNKIQVELLRDLLRSFLSAPGAPYNIRSTSHVPVGFTDPPRHGARHVGRCWR